MKKDLLSPAKAIIFSISFILLNLLLVNASSASTKRVTAINVNNQTGTAISATAATVTYTINLTEAGSSTPSNDAISLAWSGATPAGVTYSFSSGASYAPTGIILI